MPVCGPPGDALFNHGVRAPHDCGADGAPAPYDGLDSAEHPLTWPLPFPRTVLMVQHSNGDVGASGRSPREVTMRSDPVVSQAAGSARPAWRRRLAPFVAAIFVVACGSPTTSAVPTPGVSTSAVAGTVAVAAGSAATGIHKIEHVVVIMQENRSFDTYFGTYPGADGIPMANGQSRRCACPDPADGWLRRPFHNTAEHGRRAARTTQANATADVAGGAMNGFVGPGRAGEEGLRRRR